MNTNLNDTTPSAASGRTNVTWQKDGSGNVSASVANGLVKLAEITVSSPVATITFSSIPQIYSHLRIVGAARCAAAITGDGVYLQYNGDAGANYSRQFYQFAGTAASGNNSLSGSTNNILGVSTGASALANAFASNTIEIPCYSSTAMFKQAHANSGIILGATVSGITLFVFCAIWVNTAAITSIVIGNTGGSNFVAGTVFTLYGY